MQLDNVTDKRFKGSLHCVTTLLKERGISSIYTGYTVNTIREIAFCSVYFGLYENLKQIIGNSKDNSYSYIAIPLAGGLSGASAWFFSFPLDCIKANIQGKPLTKKYPMIQVALNIWKTKGLAGFYSGIYPSILRAFLVSSSRFTAYEVTYKLINIWEQQT